MINRRKKGINHGCPPRDKLWIVGTTELGPQLWRPFINGDVINKSKTKRSCREEFGPKLKGMITKSKWAHLPQSSKPNEEIQLDFSEPVFDGQLRERSVPFACISRY